MPLNLYIFYYSNMSVISIINLIIKSYFLFIVILYLIEKSGLVYSKKYLFVSMIVRQVLISFLYKMWSIFKVNRRIPYDVVIITYHILIFTDIIFVGLDIEAGENLFFWILAFFVLTILFYYASYALELDLEILSETERLKH